MLRNNVLKLDTATKDAKKKYNNEYDKLNELIAQFRAADEVRQEAYAKSVALKKQLHEKVSLFYASHLIPFSFFFLDKNQFKCHAEILTLVLN